MTVTTKIIIYITDQTFLSEEIRQPEMTEQYYYTDVENLNNPQMLLPYQKNLEKFRYQEKENIKSNYCEIDQTPYDEIYTMQQSKMLSGNRVQLVTLNSQDTGYLTCSNNSSSQLTNNITNLDSYSGSIKQKFQWDDQVPQTNDEVQLTDWEHQKSVISSTPSKCNKGIIRY